MQASAKTRLILPIFVVEFFVKNIPLDQTHVLFLPSFYSDPDKPVLGSFFKEQALAVARTGVKVGLVYFEPRSLGAFGIDKLKENHFQITLSNENGLPTVRMHGWNPYLQSSLGGLVWSFITELLISRYISVHGRPDLIHAHNVIWAGYAAKIVNKCLGIPYVITEHSGGFLSGKISPIQKKFAKGIYSKASEVITVSDTLATSLETLLMGRSQRTIPNCVDTEYFTLPPHPRDPRTFSFLAVAQLTENKGIDVLLKAFAVKFRNKSDTYLTIGGDGPKKQDLIDLVSNLGIKHKVKFLGALTRDNVREAMWNSNALVVSSFHETFGIVLIEAMATGIPVIATRCGGPNEIVTNETGLQVEAGDVLDLANAMESLRNGREYSSRVLRDYVNDTFSSSILANLLKGVYGNCLALK